MTCCCGGSACAELTSRADLGIHSHIVTSCLFRSIYSSAISTVFPPVLAVVPSVFATVVPALYAVGDDGCSPYHCRRAGNGSADDTSAGRAGWS